MNAGDLPDALFADDPLTRGIAGLIEALDAAARSLGRDPRPTQHRHVPMWPERPAV